MTTRGTYLDKIIAAKRGELAKEPPQNLNERQLEAVLTGLPPARDLGEALRRGPRPRVIAEFKRASPSEGEIREGADPRHISALYVDAGAAAISCLTDSHFQGSFEDLRAVRGSVSVPVLCKDFILGRQQIVQARREGADAILLIVAALEPPLLRELLVFATELGLSVLCEAHDEHEIDRALASGAQIVGVNARDLRTFEVDPERHVQLRGLVPRSFVYVAESGIKTREDVVRLREAEVDAMLVGTHLMRAEDPGQALDDLLAMP